jgi:lipopolysaccharide export system permease protein
MLYRRSLIREMALTTAAVLVVLIAIALVTLFIRLLGDVARGQLENEALLAYLGFSLLYFFPVLLSIALFAGVLLSFSRLWRDSEMIVWLNSGLSLTQWIRPVLGFALPITLVITLLTVVLIPWSLSKKNEYKQELRSRSEAAAIAPGLFAETHGGKRVYFVESLNPLTGIVRNIFMQSLEDGELGLVLADEGNYSVLPDGSRYLVLKQGRRYEGRPGQLNYLTVNFERYWMRLDPVVVNKDAKSIRQARISQLLRLSTPASRAELLWRAGLPLSTPILALLAIPLGFVNVRARRSYGLAIALLLYFIYNNLLSLSQAWVAQDKLNPWLGMFAIHLLMAAATALLFYQRMRVQPWSRRKT